MEQQLDAPQPHRPNLADVGWPPAPPRSDDRQTLLDEALGHAAHNGRDEAVEWLLAHGADVDGATYLGMTPLHFAAQFGRASTVRLLLEHGGDPTLRDRIHDGAPIDWARHSGHAEIESLLDKSERVVDSGLEYTPGDPVLVRVTRRGSRYVVTDDGAGVERTDKPPGWRDAAQRTVDTDSLNLSREGAVFVPVTARNLPVEPLVERVAKLSLAVYQEILDLE
jgi:Ankyrin repeats (3 copies)